MDIDFSVRWRESMHPSSDALGQASDLADDVSRPWDLEGAWHLRADDLEIDWEDTLVPLVGGLCVEALVPLLETGHAVATRTIEYGYLRMDVEGEWVRLGGDGLPGGRVPIRPFIEGQLRCAGTLVRLLLALGLDGFDVRALREDRRAAMQAWADWKPEEAARDVLGPIAAPAPRREADGEVRLERGETLSLVCGAERFVFPGDPDAWLARLTNAIEIGPDTHAVLDLRDRYGYLRVDGEGDRVRLSGDGLADLRIPRAALVAVLANVALA